MGITFNPFTGTLDFTGSGGGGGATPGGANTDVQFNDSGTFGGDADFTWNKTTNRLGFTNGSGLSFAATVTPITMVGGDDGFGDSAIVFDDATDAYIPLIFNQQAAIAAENGLQIYNSLHNIQLTTSGFTVNGPATVNDIITVNTDITSKTDFNDTNLIGTNYNATDGTPPLDGAYGLHVFVDYGASAAATGNLNGFQSNVEVNGSGNNLNEWAAFNGLLNVKIGTGFSQTAGPSGHAWFFDGGVAGPIAVQPQGLNGFVLAFNNYYNGNPSSSPSNAFSIVTAAASGPGLDAIHAAADSFPIQYGLSISGASFHGAALDIGFTTAIQVGGSNLTPWGESTSRIGTGLHIRDHRTAGIAIDNQGLATAPDVTWTGFLEGTEMTAPSAGAANTGRLFFQDNGAGKTQLMVLFNTGAAQQIAIQA